MAAQLLISTSAADHHVRHISEKIGVSSRAGATLFALQHGLLCKIARSRDLRPHRRETHWL